MHFKKHCAVRLCEHFLGSMDSALHLMFLVQCVSKKRKAVIKVNKRELMAATSNRKGTERGENMENDKNGNSERDHYK